MYIINNNVLSQYFMNESLFLTLGFPLPSVEIFDICTSVEINNDSSFFGEM